MKKTKYIFFCTLFVFLSCSSKKDILYLQNSNNDYTKVSSSKKENQIVPNDILRIKVTSPDLEAVVPYNKLDYNNNTSLEILKLSGYLVDDLGFINFPILGKIFLNGKSYSEAENFIYQLLLDGNHLINHSVSIRLLNAKYTVLGEVNNPGTFSFYESTININQALGYAGDLTINGKRKDIRLIRENNDKIKIYNIDLTNSEYISADSYRIKNGDVIIVNPNTSKVKNAGIIGNSGTLLSLLSFILSLVIITTNS